MNYILEWPSAIIKKEDYPPRRRIYIHEDDINKFPGDNQLKKLYKITVEREDKEINEIVRPMIRPDITEKNKAFFAGNNLPKLKGSKQLYKRENIGRMQSCECNQTGRYNLQHIN